MVIVVLQGANIYKQVINLDSSDSDSAIEHARNRLNEVIVGVPANNVAARASRVGGGLERRAFDSAVTALQKHNTGSSMEKRFSGIGKLFQQPELLADPAMSQGAMWLIEDTFATSVFEEASEPGGLASVVIGEENVEESLRNYSVVVSKYGTSSTAEGIIGVMAPTRMEYETAIPAVRHLAGHLDQMTMLFYGGY